LNEESVKHCAHGERSGKWQQQFGAIGETEFFGGITHFNSRKHNQCTAEDGGPAAGFS